MKTDTPFRAGYASYSAVKGPDGLRYLEVALIEMERQADGVWHETGRTEPLASFPAPRWSSPWLEGTQRHARRFAFAHPLTVAWVGPWNGADQPPMAEAA